MSEPTRTGPRVLVIRLSAIGDVVVTTPVSRVLREAMPDAHLGWVVESRAAGLLSGNPYLDETIVWDRKKGGLKLSDLRSLRERLRAGRYEWAIDCQGNLRSALVARLSGARRIVGNSAAKEWAHLLYNIRIPRSQADLSSRQRCLDLLQPLGIRSSDRQMVVAISPEEALAARQALAGAGVGMGTDYACLVPATTWKQKHWFDDRWGALARLLREQLRLTPVVMGGPADTTMAERIRSASGGECAVLAGKTSLKAAAAVLQGARLSVAVDTALMHASVAVGTPTVGVCGASWWKGFRDYPNFALVHEPLPCSPCLHRPTCDGRFDCMTALTPERVLAAARQVLGNGLPVLS